MKVIRIVITVAMMFALLIGLQTIVSCKSQTKEDTKYTPAFGDTSGSDYYISGMHYASHGSYGVIINITKDSLECAYYQKQLKSTP